MFFCRPTRKVKTEHSKESSFLRDQTCPPPKPSDKKQTGQCLSTVFISNPFRTSSFSRLFERGSEEKITFCFCIFFKILIDSRHISGFITPNLFQKRWLYMLWPENSSDLCGAPQLGPLRCPTARTSAVSNWYFLSLVKLFHKTSQYEN